MGKKIKRGGFKIDFIYVRFLDVYRLILSVMFAYMAFTSMKVNEVSTMIIIASFILYAIIFSLMGNRKSINYIEWILVMVGIFLFQPQIGTMMYLIILVPILKVISNKMSVLETVLFSFSALIFAFLSGATLSFSMLMAVSMFLFMLVLNVNFKKIGIIEKEMGELQKINSELQYENSRKDNQVDIISKLFFRKKRLEGIKDIRGIIDEITETSNELYNSDYSVLYQFRNGIYERVMAKGNYEGEVIPKQIEMSKGKKFSLTKKQMIIPIEYEKRAWGLLVIHGKRTQLTDDGRKVDIEFEGSDLEVIYLYLDSALARLKEVKLTNQLTEAAFYDRLTNVPNRAYLEKDLLLEKMDEVRDTKKPFAVLLLDIDSFKSFNDTFGHSVGDEVLQSVSRIATDTLKGTTDKFGRWGGEEFVAYLTGTPREINEKAERLRQEIANFDFSYRKITVSGGIAFYGRDGKSLDVVMKKADQALYHSKEMGKNRITFYHTINQ